MTKIKEAEKYYQKVKSEYKQNGKSFESYDDVFKFATDFRNQQREKDKVQETYLRIAEEILSTEEGRNMLKQTLKEIENKGFKGPTFEEYLTKLKSGDE